MPFSQYEPASFTSDSESLMTRTADLETDEELDDEDDDVVLDEIGDDENEYMKLIVMRAKVMKAQM